MKHLDPNKLEDGQRTVAKSASRSIPADRMRQMLLSLLGLLVASVSNSASVWILVPAMVLVLCGIANIQDASHTLGLWRQLKQKSANEIRFRRDIIASLMHSCVCAFFAVIGIYLVLRPGESGLKIGLLLTIAVMALILAGMVVYIERRMKQHQAS